MRKYLLFILSLIFLASCGGSDDAAPTVPTSYDATSFETDASAEVAIISGIGTLASTMQNGRDAANTVTASSLTTALQTGDPSIQSITTTHYTGLINGWVTELEKASGNVFTPSATPTGDGGVYNNAGSKKYLFDENAAELEQFIEKGLCAAACYNHAFNSVLTTNITTASVNKVLALYGTTPAFPNSSAQEALSARYASRREAPDTEGLYTAIKNDFIELQFAVSTGNTSLQNDETASLKLNWEKALAATVINYLHTSVRIFSDSQASDDDKSSALHAWAEAVGFLGGFYTVEGKTITDEQIASILTKMNAPVSGVPTPYTFVTGSNIATEVAGLSEAITDLQAIYSFTDAEIEGFKQSYTDK